MFFSLVNSVDIVVLVIAYIIFGIAILCSRGHGKKMARFKFIVWIISIILITILYFALIKKL